MLQYQKVDVPEGIDINKTNASKECELCYYWYFNPIQDGLFRGCSRTAGVYGWRGVQKVC